MYDYIVYSKSARTIVVYFNYVHLSEWIICYKMYVARVKTIRPLGYITWRRRRRRRNFPVKTHIIIVVDLYGYQMNSVLNFWSPTTSDTINGMKNCIRLSRRCSIILRFFFFFRKLF